MKLDHYQLEANPDFLDFEFSSIGPKGRIKKIIRFTKMNFDDPSNEIFNLGFGDFNSEKNTMDDLVVTDNKDAQKVLLTVAAAVLKFTDKHPNSLVFAKGSTPARTRYYLMGISANLEYAEKSFDIWGYLNDNWELFQRNRPYIALLAKRK